MTNARNDSRLRVAATILLCVALLLIPDITIAQESPFLTGAESLQSNILAWATPIAVILVTAFVAIVPFGLFPYALDLGRSSGLEHWTAWLNVPFSIFVGWIFVTLEKVGENSSNPFEGGPNDVPISFLARRIEIEMRTMLGEKTDLKPIEAKYNILF